MSFLEKENHNGLSRVIFYPRLILQSLLFTRKLLVYFNQAGLLARSSQSHPSQIASVDFLHQLLLSNELTATGIAPDFNGIPF